MLKNPYTRSQIPTAAPRPVPMLNRFHRERTAVPDDKNTTIITTQIATIKNATSPRQKRDAHNITVAAATINANDEGILTTELTASSTYQTIIYELNNTRNDRKNTFNDKNSLDDESNGTYSTEPVIKNKTAAVNALNDTHPTFHVTYWMFYPYSQVYFSI